MKAHRNFKPAQRFWMQTERGSSCWLWRGGQAGAGYGHLSVNGRREYAHRFSYEMFRGPIPTGKEIDHLCRTRLCVNPDHLEIVSHRDNILRGTAPHAVNAAKTHCPAGHQYTEVNTYINEKGWRQCRECHKLSERKRRQ